jgi:hypothetical protein
MLILDEAPDTVLGTRDAERSRDPNFDKRPLETATHLVVHVTQLE